MVADAKECGEGVSFLGVRKLLLTDLPADPLTFIQRVGRSVRFNGHASLPPEERTVDVLMYAGVLKKEHSHRGTEPSADELLLERSSSGSPAARLRSELRQYYVDLGRLKGIAFDEGCWQEEPEDTVPAGAGDQPAGSAAGYDEGEASAGEGEEERCRREREEARKQQHQQREQPPPPPPQGAPPPREEEQRQRQQ
ncbi:hypothetical protein EMIHUDRAFT_460894, partial [Emiliania huxleyi CCMP1516]|uniref:Helicase C-terminal domain-containing protein n=2 Tax=Emiliania huxleyi TaxID=2903 RepID=A0A0D3KVY4_EMIH1